MSFSSSFMRLLTKAVWPWFLKHIWPKLQEHVAKGVLALILAFFRHLETLIASSWAERARDAAERAQAAEDSAGAAVDPTQAQAHRAEAAAWSHVAQQSEVSYDELARRVRALEEELYGAVQKSVMEVDPKLDMDPLGLNLTIDEFTTRLPELKPLKTGDEASPGGSHGRPLPPSIPPQEGHARLPESGAEDPQGTS